MSHFSSTEIIERLTQNISSKREVHQLREGWDDFLKQLNELEEGEVLNCDMLGSFYKSEGELGFRPAPVLSKEINYRYQGQPPVVIAEGSQQELEKEDEASVAFETINKPAEEPPAEKKTEVLPDKAKKTEQQQEKAAPASGEKEDASPDSIVRPGEAEESSSGLRFILLAASVLIAALIIFAVYHHQESSDDSAPENISETADRDEEDPELLNDPDSDSQMVPELTVPETESADDSLRAADLLERFDRPDSVIPVGDYGLMGEMQRVRGESFGLVVHSLKSRDRAIEQDASLYLQGYRTITYPVETSDGRQSWRVSVGQFETVEDAQAAASQLPEPYRSNYFISKFRP